VLAVSLNVVNGFTGQFSLGHAGFMAVGAYTSAKITLVLANVQLDGLPPGVSDQLVFAWRCWRPWPWRPWPASWWACRPCACAATTWPS